MCFKYYSYICIVGKSIEAAATSMAVNHPRIVVILSDTNQQIFIVCEQQILCEVVSIEMALFITFGTYYTLTYNIQRKLMVC